MPIQKVLLVDDEPDIRKLGLISLRNIGKLQVFISADGPDALDVAAREQPDVVLLDVMMPGMDGLETLARLRQRESTASLPVIFLTAATRPEDVTTYLALGVTGVIQKPFDPMRLPAQVQALFPQGAP